MAAPFQLCLQQGSHSVEGEVIIASIISGENGLIFGIFFLIGMPRASYMRACLHMPLSLATMATSFRAVFAAVQPQLDKDML